MKIVTLTEKQFKAVQIALSLAYSEEHVQSRIEAYESVAPVFGLDFSDEEDDSYDE